MTVSPCRVSTIWCRPASLTAATRTGIPALAKRTNSGRTPSSVRAPAGARATAFAVRIGWPAKRATPFSSSQGRMFIPGEPMKWPTNVCRGRSKSSTGVPTCTTVPSCMTTTWSAKVIASVWSCVT